MTPIFIGVPIKMYHFTKFLNAKKLGLLLFLLIFLGFLYHEIKPFFSTFVVDKTSSSPPLTRITEPGSGKKEIKPTSIDISRVSIEQLLLFANNDYNFPIFKLNGVEYQVTYKEEAISHLQLSPDKKIIGFYVYPSQENSLLSEVDLVLMNMKNKSFKEISEDGPKVSNWEWKNNREFIIYINCGTGCHLAHVRSAIDGKLIAEYLDKEN